MELSRELKTLAEIAALRIVVKRLLFVMISSDPEATKAIPELSRSLHRDLARMEFAGTAPEMEPVLRARVEQLIDEMLPAIDR